ncbi:MAG: methionyl-tRNA formyltransferase, partial [Acidobacteriota bacterium]
AETGVTTMLMDEGLDTGPILLQRQIPIEPQDTGESLEQKLARLGAKLLLETLAAWEQERLTPQPQDDSRATLAPRIKKEDARIDWNRTAETIECAARGFIPWPVAHTQLRGTLVRIWRATVAPPGEGRPGATLAISSDGVLVGCGLGTRLLLLEVQAEGKKRMAADAFARGRRLALGDRWG